MRTFIVACLACVPMVLPQHRALAEEKKSDEGGPTFASDVVAKHFSFIVGAVVLSPFKLAAVDTDANPVTTEFRLETGNTDARGLLEAGFRRRWAWEEWEPEDFRDTTRAARKKRDEARRQLALLTSEPKTERDIPEISKYQEQLANAEQDIATARRIKMPKSTDVFSASKETAHDKPWIWAYLIPDNYVVRLGFALGADKPSGAASIAGAGDFYLEAGVGFDIVRLLYRSAESPLKMSFGLEALGSFNNDAVFGDLHDRRLLGLGMTAGVPLENNQLAEIVLRIGAVWVESLQFVDDNSRLVHLKNEVPRFNTESGLGVDVEVNVPISETLGYIFIRGSINSGFDPNPWSTLVGYTIPFGSLGIRP